MLLACNYMHGALIAAKSNNMLRGATLTNHKHLLGLGMKLNLVSTHWPSNIISDWLIVGYIS